MKMKERHLMNMSPFVSLLLSTQKTLMAKHLDLVIVEIPTQPVSLQVCHLYQGTERTPDSALPDSLERQKKRRKKETLSPT